MKKLFLIIPFLCFAVFFTSCEKKSKISVNTMTVSIETLDKSLTLADRTIKLTDVFGNCKLAAVVRNSSGQDIYPDSVLWGIDDTELGTFEYYDNTKPAEITFSASGKTGTGTITLTYAGIQASVKINIGSI